MSAEGAAQGRFERLKKIKPSGFAGGSLLRASHCHIRRNEDQSGCFGRATAIGRCNSAHEKAGMIW